MFGRKTDCGTSSLPSCRGEELRTEYYLAKKIEYCRLCGTSKRLGTDEAVLDVQGASVLGLDTAWKHDAKMRT
jgi:hypothetical protein